MIDLPVVVAHPSHPDVTVTGVVLACGEGDVGQLGLGPDVMEKSRPALVNIDDQKIDLLLLVKNQQS